MTSMQENPQSLVYKAFDKSPEPITGFLSQLVVRRCQTTIPHVLDVGCGPGRMIPEFRKLGFVIDAIEPDPDYFAQARVFHDGSQVNVRNMGFLEIDDEDRYDLITAINDPFSYLLYVEQRASAIHRLHRALKKDGILFLDIPNIVWILKNYIEPQSIKATYGEYEILREIKHEFDLVNCIMLHRDRFEIRKNDILLDTVEKTHLFAIIGFPELDYFLKSTGFVEIETYNSYKARQSETLSSSRIMISVRKG